LNNDGINDFSIMLSKTEFHCILCQGFRTNSNVTVAPLNGNATFLEAEDSGSVINGSLNWSSELQSLASTTNSYNCVSDPPLGHCYWTTVGITGSWSEQTNKYLSLKVIVGTY